MKKVYLLFLNLFILIQVQAQITFTSAPQAINHLNGHWTWVRSCGGLAGVCNYPSTVGYSRDLVFSAVNSANDSVQYQLYQNNVLQNSQTVKVSTVAPMFSGSWTLQDVKVANNMSLSLSITHAKTDTIWLAENCSDCFIQQYARNLTVDVKEEKMKFTGPLFYPNPVTDVLKLNLLDAEIKHVFIFDALGKKVKFILDGNKIDVKDLAPGIYFLQVETDQGKLRERMIKSHG